MGSGEFIEETVKELKIRCYSPSSIKTYRSQLVAFLRWVGGYPNRVTRQNVRDYLMFLADAGFSTAKLSGALSAIRTAFDDFFCRRITAGLVTPKIGKQLPTTLSPNEVRSMIEACRRLRDKMLVSLLYATGMRVSEVAKLRWSDFDYERNVVLIRQGKGSKDRQVKMPQSFIGLLNQLSDQVDPQDYVFQSETLKSRHLAVRTIQRVVKRVAELADIPKHVTPHVLRHAYATHLFEAGTDIRLIQKLLGHANLETTCIYVKVANLVQKSVASPLDRIFTKESSRRSDAAKYRFEVHSKPEHSQSLIRVTLSIQGSTGIVYFTGIVAMQPEEGLWALHIPTLEHWAEPLNQIGHRRQWFEENAFYNELRFRVVTTCSGLTRDVKG